MAAEGVGGERGGRAGERYDSLQHHADVSVFTAVRCRFAREKPLGPCAVMLVTLRNRRAGLQVDATRLVERLASCSREQRPPGGKVNDPRRLQNVIFSAACRSWTRKRVLVRVSVEIGSPPPRVCRRPRPSSKDQNPCAENATGQPPAANNPKHAWRGSPHHQQSRKIHHH